MLDDPKALTKYDRTRLVPMKPELMAVEDINAKIDQVEAITEDPSIMTFGSALELAGITSTKWESLKQVCKRRELEYELERIEYIKQRFENRIFESALKNQANATMAIFALKHHYGWRERQDVNIETTTVTKVDVSSLDEETKRKLAEKFLADDNVLED
jgi:hypothetical protein